MFLFGIKSNKGADVNEDFQLETNAVVRTKEHFKNGQSGEVWSSSFSVAPSATGKIFWHMKNTGMVPLKLTAFRFTSSVVGYIEIIKTTGVPVDVSATTLTPLSRNTTKSPVIAATIKSDTGATGLVTSGTYYFIEIDNAGQQESIRSNSNIVIGPGDIIALNWVGSTGTVRGTVTIASDGDD